MSNIERIERLLDEFDQNHSESSLSQAIGLLVGLLKEFLDHPEKNTHGVVRLRFSVPSHACADVHVCVRL
jgi:hypothetical protein